MSKIYVIVTHPIQYNSPFFDAISQDTCLDFRALYLSSFGVGQSFDKGFSTNVQFDVPLLEKHDYEFLFNPVPTFLRHSLLKFVNPKLWSLIWKQDEVFIFYGWNNLSTLIGVVLCYMRKRRFYLRSDGNLLRNNSHRSWKQNISHKMRVLFLDRILASATGALYIGCQNMMYYEKMGIDKTRLHFVPFAIDSSRFVSKIDYDFLFHFKNSNRFKNMNLPICIFVGKLIPIKGIDVLLEAAIQLREVCNFLIIGSGIQQKSLSKRYSEYENIYFEGFVNQLLLPSYYNVSTLVCLPSQQESWGLSISEGLACGLVPIVSDSVGCATDLVSTTSGLVFETGNSQDLCKKIFQGIQLSQDKSVNEKIEKVAGVFSMNNAVQLLKIALKSD